MPKVRFTVSLPLNLFYHLQFCCGTHPALKNETYQRDFSRLVSKDACKRFSQIQNRYPFMQRCFVEALGESMDLEYQSREFVAGFTRFAEELAPLWKSILRDAYGQYEPYWRRRFPELKRLKDEIEKEWQRCEEAAFSRVVEVTRIPWKRETFTTHIVDALSYGGMLFGESYWAMGASSPKTCIHSLIHELVHCNIEEAVNRTCQGLDLDRNQWFAIGETFARLVEMEVTRSAAPWAEEPVEEKAAEARAQGFADFFNVAEDDWSDYIERIENYPSIEDFMRTEAITGKSELDKATIASSIFR